MFLGSEVFVSVGHCASVDSALLMLLTLEELEDLAERAWKRCRPHLATVQEICQAHSENGNTERQISLKQRKHDIDHRLG